MPAAAAFGWMISMLLNLYLGARITAMAGNLPRPLPDVPSMTYPVGFGLGLAAALPLVLAISAGPAHALRVHYAWNDQDAWFLLNRTRDIHLVVTPAFRYYFWIKGDGSGNRLEVKLSNVSDETFWYHFSRDFTDWRVVSVRYDQFEPFGPAGAPLEEIGKIEFAVGDYALLSLDQKRAVYNLSLIHI